MGMFNCVDCYTIADSKDGESMICITCGKMYCGGCAEDRFALNTRSVDMCKQCVQDKREAQREAQADDLRKQRQEEGGSS